MKKKKKSRQQQYNFQTLYDENLMTFFFSCSLFLYVCTSGCRMMLCIFPFSFLYSVRGFKNNNIIQHEKKSTKMITVKVSGLAMLASGIWVQIALHRYMELSTYYTNTFQIILVGTGLLILFVGTIACCCTVKAQSSLLYLVSTMIFLLFCIFRIQVNILGMN